MQREEHYINIVQFHQFYKSPELKLHESFCFLLLATSFQIIQKKASNYCLSSVIESVYILILIEFIIAAPFEILMKNKALLISMMY